MLHYQHLLLAEQESSAQLTQMLSLIILSHHLQNFVTSLATGRTKSASFVATFDRWEKKTT